MTQTPNEKLHIKQSEITFEVNVEWTTETRIIAALVAKLGGKVELTNAEMLGVEGLHVDNADDFGVRLEATSKTTS